MKVKTKKLKPLKLEPNIKGVGFEFVPDGHSYYLDGVRLTGVTTILSVKAKPALIDWAAKEAVKYVEEHSERSSDGVYYVSSETLTSAKVAHRKKKEEAGAKGTDVHAIIEGIIKYAIEKNNGIVESINAGMEDLTNPQVKHFVSWAIDNDVKFIASEEKVFSRELFVGGTIDFICEIDKETWIGDIKTSSGIYPEHFFQIAGYQKLLEDMAETDGGMAINIKGHVILNLRKDGSFEEKRSISNEDNRKAFLACYELYRIDEKSKGTLI